MSYIHYTIAVNISILLGATHILVIISLNTN